MKKYILVILVCLLNQMIQAQGTTTSSISGHVEDKELGDLIGVNVRATHIPTGSVYGTITDFSGNFRIVNMKIGGPYKVELSYVGYQTVNIANIYLQLGEQWKQNFNLSQDDVLIEGIEIVAQVGFAGQSTGASSQISEEDVLYMPSVDRELDDLVRLTPQVKESFGEGISIAGMNNRFNAIYIDGAVNNDVFGLSPSGTNGGQTGISPISPEIIDQIQVVISPFDVSYGGFAGGGINVVTKSGTNNLFGSAYYYQQNESLVGKDNKTLLDRLNEGLDSTDPDYAIAERVADFTDQVYGFTVGGPILKDKLFFFFNGEIQKDETPIAFDFAEYRGNSTLAEIENLRSHLVSKYNYEPGNFLEKADRLDGSKWFLKLDYNINENHKLSFRHQYTNAEEYNVNTSGGTFINFENNGLYFPSTTNSSAIELNSSFGKSISNNLIVGYTQVKDDRDPLGADFPNVTIMDGDGDISFGSEGFSTANQLDQKILTITDNLKWFKGDHTFTFGTHNEISNFYNLFIRQNFGEYEFPDLASFLEDNPVATNYFRSYSLVDDVTGDGSAAAADFTAVQFGLYAQNEWRINPDLTLTFGLRLDVPFIVDDQEEDTYFNTTTLPLIKEAYPIVGEARSGTMPEGQLMWSPRVGFNYDLSGNNSSVLRGGVGLFTSRIPFVWPGGAFINNGLTIGDVDQRDINPTESTVLFIADPDQQYTNPDFSIPSGQMDLYATDFKYPQILRASLAYDRVIGNGWKTSFEAVFTKTINNIYYQNVNSDPEISFQWTNTPDNRPVYVGRSIDNTYSAVYFANNTSEGYAYNLTTSLEKNIIKGLNLFAAYTYGDARSIFEGTSSQNSSQWRGSFNVNGRNFSEIGRSDFAPGHRIISALSYKIDWGGSDDFSSIFSLFYEGESGNNYSYVYGFGTGDPRNLNNEQGITNRTRSLIFIPETPNDIHLVEGDLTSAEQWELLDAFIEADAYLSNHRGEYAEKNGARTPFESQFDFKYLQNLGFNALGKDQRLQLSIDIENFANLLNSSWGAVYSNPFDYGLIEFEGYDGTVPMFYFDDERLDLEKYNISNFFSRWRARIGVRYFFK
jgi:outer membrane receptor for ferrienterochelin and colicin